MKLYVYSIILLASITAFAEGGVGHGGGKVFVCNENGEEKVYLADTYDLAKAGKLSGIEESYPDATIESVVQIFERTRPEKTLVHPFKPHQKVSLGWMVEHTFLNLKFIAVDSLPDLPDDNIPTGAIPANCTKQQLAIQDLGKGRVRVNFSLLNKMTSIEQGFFKLHETRIAIRDLPDADTTPIRSGVRRVADILTDPNFSAHNLILATLQEKPLIDDYPDPNWGAAYYHNNCEARRPYLPVPALDHSLRRPLCRLAARVSNFYYDKKDRETAIRSLVRVPQVLDCQFTGEVTKMIDWNPARNFQVVRISGPGLPISDSKYGNHDESIYQLNFADGTNYSNMNKEDLLTFRHVRQRGIDSTGVFDWRVTWKYGNLPLTLSILNYSQMTEEFTGELQIIDAAVDDLEPPANLDSIQWTTYSISCHAPKVEFAIDMLNSHK